MNARLNALLNIMERLRGVDGCPWDREQTFSSIVPYTIEEAYEVADAIERGDMSHLRDELGDLLFQVVFHARMAQEAGHFDFEGVAAAIGEKLVRRHPHVFPESTAAGTSSDGTAHPITSAAQLEVWENIKAAERAAGSRGDATVGGALADVPTTLPALMRAVKLSKRAARVGFDFAQAGQSADKVAEELAEVREAMAALPDEGTDPAASADVFEEVGDLLFAAANLARKLDVDAEAALRAANLKFERRFTDMERLAAAADVQFAALDLPAQEALWQAVKRGE